MTTLTILAATLGYLVVAGLRAWWEWGRDPDLYSHGALFIALLWPIELTAWLGFMIAAVIGYVWFDIFGMRRDL